MNKQQSRRVRGGVVGNQQRDGGSLSAWQVKQRDTWMHEGSYPSLITTCYPLTRPGVRTAIRNTFGIAPPCQYRRQGLAERGQGGAALTAGVYASTSDTDRLL